METTFTCLNHAENQRNKRVERNREGNTNHEKSNFTFKFEMNETDEFCYF